MRLHYGAEQLYCKWVQMGGRVVRRPIAAAARTTSAATAGTRTPQAISAPASAASAPGSSTICSAELEVSAGWQAGVAHGRQERQRFLCLR